MFNKISQNFSYKSVRAIKDKNVLIFLNKLMKNSNLKNILEDETIEKKFLVKYAKWIQSSKLNNIKNLRKFKFMTFANGSSQVFDYFYAKNRTRRFRAYKGEYAYHFTSWRNHFPNWNYIKNLDIKKNDAVIISMPFSDTGSKHSEMDDLIKICNKLDVPVLVDCCYLAMCKGIEFDFNQKCVKEISFSLSKAFPVSRVRIGMRLSKIDDDDPLFFFQKLGLVNRVGAYIGLKLIEKFGFDYIYKKYFKLQEFYCKKMFLEPSSVVCLATGGKKWKSYNRGNKRNRLCLSRLYEKK